MEKDKPNPQKKRKSLILKISLFATGLSGIVAEYILSTLASYFLGDSVFQWTIVLSLMLFSMGLGSRVSRYFTKQLLEKFIIIEFILSIVVSFTAMIVYLIAAYTVYDGFFIYSLSIVIGLMIGLEIPLVTRLNEAYQDLRVNISAVMENDYYGSLLGGIFFAFIGLPYLGMTYTPFVLGGVNFAVAILLYLKFKKLVIPKFRTILNISMVGVFVIILTGLIFSQQIIMFAEQRNYLDKVIFEKQSKYQKIVITQWKNHYWLYLNARQQFSTLDEEMYHEPLVHPILKLAQKPKNILVLGGGDGCAARDILKHKGVDKITLVDLDPAMTELAKTHPILLSVNDSSFYHPKVTVFNQDAFTFMADTEEYYDAIIIDLPDPRTVELNKLYTTEMYQLCYKHLRPKGLIITQAGSPYYATKAFECINLTMKDAGFQTVKMHNQVITLGEWGWIMGAKHLNSQELKQSLRNLKFNELKTRWINNEAMLLLTSFGKKDIFISAEEPIKINKIHDPVLYRYYMKGNWDMY